MSYCPIVVSTNSGAPIWIDCIGTTYQVSVSPRKEGKSYRFVFSFETKEEAERCFLELRNGAAEIWQYAEYLESYCIPNFRKYYEVSKENDDMDFTNEQLERIDAIYDATIELCTFFTDGKFNEDDTSVYGELADLIAEVLTNHNYPVHFPTHVTTDTEDKIVDIWE